MASKGRHARRRQVAGFSLARPAISRRLFIFLLNDSRFLKLCSHGFLAVPRRYVSYTPRELFFMPRRAQSMLPHGALKATSAAHSFFACFAYLARFIFRVLVYRNIESFRFRHISAQRARRRYSTSHSFPSSTPCYKRPPPPKHRHASDDFSLLPPFLRYRVDSSSFTTHTSAQTALPRRADKVFSLAY